MHRKRNDLRKSSQNVTSNCENAVRNYLICQQQKFNFQRMLLNKRKIVMINKIDIFVNVKNK